MKKWNVQIQTNIFLNANTMIRDAYHAHPVRSPQFRPCVKFILHAMTQKTPFVLVNVCQMHAQQGNTKQGERLIIVYFAKSVAQHAHLHIYTNAKNVQVQQTCSAVLAYSVP
jgi:hypothetical protein